MHPHRIRDIPTHDFPASGTIRVMRESGRGVNRALVETFTKRTRKPPLVIEAYDPGFVTLMGLWSPAAATALSTARVIIIDSPSMGGGEDMQRLMTQMIEKRTVSTWGGPTGKSAQEIPLRGNALIVISEIDGVDNASKAISELPGVVTMTTISE